MMLQDQHQQHIRCNIKNIKPYHAQTTEDKSLCFPPDPGFLVIHPSLIQINQINFFVTMFLLQFL